MFLHEGLRWSKPPLRKRCRLLFPLCPRLRVLSKFRKAHSIFFPHALTTPESQNFFSNQCDLERTFARSKQRDLDICVILSVHGNGALLTKTSAFRQRVKDLLLQILSNKTHSLHETIKIWESQKENYPPARLPPRLCLLDPIETSEAFPPTRSNGST